MVKISNKQDNKRMRRIIEAIIAIVIFLLLIRSCAKEFNWTIGKLFGTSSKHEITNESDDVIILNKNLKFDAENADITLEDSEYKISYSFDLINPTDFTCTTSDANVATCYVKDGYVVINPKSVGEISVFIQTKTNNKIYKASMKVNINDINRSLTLSSKSGMIVLSKSNKKILTYNLNNIDGEVTVSSSDESLATVKVSKGVITIIGKRAGNCRITVSVVDKTSNKTFKIVYNLTLVNNITDSNDKDNNQTGGQKPSDTPNNPSGPTETPTTPNEPIETNKPVVEKDNNNYLNSIKPSVGQLSPKFDKNVTNYNINLENNISSIDISINKDSSKSSVKYIFNNKTINKLNGLSLNVGDNILQIEVTAENKEKRTYSIIINRKEKDSYSNYLTDLSINGYSISPKFDKNTSFYSVNVSYKESAISLNYQLEDSTSSIDVFINNNKVNDIKNVTLNDGENKLEVAVTDRTGAKRVYLITVYKPVRTIKLYNSSYLIYMEQIPYNISYSVLEDGIEINDYELSDISVDISNFNGSYKLNKGYITITPNNSDIDKKVSLNVTYNNKTVTTNLTFKIKDYHVNSPALEYDISYVNNSGKKNIIINNNLLVGTITKISIENGFRLKSSNGAYIDVVAGNNLIDITYDNSNSGNTSIVVKVDALKVGTSSIIISGNIFDKEINRYTVKLNIIGKYNVVIDANGGFFDSVTDKYTYLVESSEIIDLSEFNALKVDDEENCLFFKLESFNTKKDGTGTRYDKSDVITNFSKDITLYAIYTSTSSFETLESTERLYLTEVDLFHNEDYYEKYNVDKIIYPGAEGAHVMSLTNNGIGTIKITRINLEEDTVCISSGKCVNIGYIIKSALDVNEPYTYFYGTNNSYQILNKDSNTIHTFGSLTGYHTENNISINPNIEIGVGETKEISLLWKWVDIDDQLDTAIGSSYDTIGNTYTLTVSIDFERINNTCTLP